MYIYKSYMTSKTIDSYIERVKYMESNREGFYIKSL
jgi:hypothetical protein